MKNVSASIKAQLKSAARHQGIAMNFMLIRYANERLLGRLSTSPYAKDFCLKGGMLLPFFNNGEMYRPTSDLDISCIVDDASEEFVHEMLNYLCNMRCKSFGGDMDFDDGLVFLPEIKSRHYEVDAGGSSSYSFKAILDNSQIHMRVDAGFGAAIAPSIVTGEYPSLFQDSKHQMPPPVIHMYPMESVVSEKLHANAIFGKYSTRTKDIYDMFTLLNSKPVNNENQAEAISKTFINRRLDIPEEFSGLSDEYAKEGDNLKRWIQFVENTNLKTDVPKDLTEVCKNILSHLKVPIEMARSLGPVNDYFVIN
jgi:predicted nucleotidyltransferase component of viral defense system